VRSGFCGAWGFGCDLANLKAGAVATTGVFKGRQFGNRGMSVEEIGLSKALLEVRAGVLEIW